VSGFQSRDIVFEHTAKAHDFESVGSERFLVVIPQRYKQEKSRQKRDDYDADSGSRQELEVKMFLAEEPCRAAA
jgi:hypothetical protein